jgi:exopolyphosphatase / guanosine-5'-triphosphate,3'-diphosphate pyrophosphatase
VARLAAIDIGSNAMRLRIVDVDDKNPGLLGFASSPNVQDVHLLRAPVRLGREVFLTGTLTNKAISAALEALCQFREAMDDAEVDLYRAVATSAVREAKNGHFLVERAQREAGISIDVIEGEEEARLVQLAVVRRLKLKENSALLIDIGGGSTELTLIDKGEPSVARSLPIGTVRLLEAFFEEGAPVAKRASALAANYVERVLTEVDQDVFQTQPDLLVATGGNMDTLALLCPQMIDQELAINLASAEALIRQLKAMNVQERVDRFELRPDRADTLIPASMILFHIASHFDHPSVLAPGVGVKEGILEELFDQYFSRKNDSAEAERLTQTCVRLGRRYHFDEKHGLLVAKLATQIFDDFYDRQGKRPRERLLLQCAAILHDIGDFVRFEGHHKHGWYLIEHSAIMGLSPADRSLVANIARYHRKSFPDTSHEPFRELGRADRAIVREMAAILRLADALDREHRGKVQSVRASVTDETLRLAVEGEDEIELEEWTVHRKAGLFRSVFDLDVEVTDRPMSAKRPSSPSGNILEEADLYEE